MKACHSVGFGFDSHLFSGRGTLILGGVVFPGVSSLKGHSDGDAILHSVTDALLGAAGLGDIGDHFSDKNKEWKGAASSYFLRNVMDKLSRKRLCPVHIDVTVVADKPKLSAKKRDIEKMIATLCRMPRGSVSVKAKTQEGLCWFPKCGGIAAWAVATLKRP